MSISTFCSSSLILLLAVVCYIESLDYDDLIATGKYCPSRDKCEGYRRRLNYMERNCECDSECASYNDCCIDAGGPRRRNQATRRSKPKNVKCVPYGTNYYAGVYMIAGCRKNWNGPSEVRDKCVGPTNFSDPLNAAPMTSTAQNKTYRNIYCAECNDADIDSLKLHEMQLGCEGLQGVTEEQILGDLIYINGTWGVYRNIAGSNTFLGCSIVFDVPRYLNGSVRFCRPNVVSTCDPDWTSPRIKRDCEGYMAVVYDRQNVPYRNPHCASCNYKSAEDLFCTSSDMGKNRPFSFGLLMDFNQSDGDEVGKRPLPTPSCPSKHIYDPFFKRCKRMTCLMPGDVVVDGRCTRG